MTHVHTDPALVEGGQLLLLKVKSNEHDEGNDNEDAGDDKNHEDDR